MDPNGSSGGIGWILLRSPMFCTAPGWVAEDLDESATGHGQVVARHGEFHLVGGWPTPLKNDGLRHLELWHSYHFLYKYGKINKMIETTNQIRIISYIYISQKDYLIYIYNYVYIYISQWEGWHPIYEMGNKSHVPNHQAVMVFLFMELLLECIKIIMKLSPNCSVQITIKQSNNKVYYSPNCSVQTIWGDRNCLSQ